MKSKNELMELTKFDPVLVDERLKGRTTAGELTHRIDGSFDLELLYSKVERLGFMLYR